MANLLQKASIVLTPTAYDNGKVLCAKPSEPPYGDFDFSRNSAATRVNAQGLVENVQILSSNLVQNGDFSEEGVQEVSNGSFSQEGSEELANSDFTNGLTSWNGGIGNTVVNNQLIANSTGLFYQSLNLTTNKTYKAVINIDSISQGGVKFYCQGNQSQTIATSGVHTIYIVSGSSNSLVGINPIGTFEAVVNSISFREVGQDWTFSSGVTLTALGAKITHTPTAGVLQQASVLTIGKQYKLTYEITENVSGGLKITSATNNSMVTTVGTHTKYFKSNSPSTFSIARTDASNNDVTITNISVKEVGQNWDLVSANASIGENKLIANSVVTENIATQSGVVPISKPIILKFDLILNSGGFRVLAGSGGTATNITTSGTYTLYETSGTGGTLTLQSRFGGFDGSVTNLSIIEITTDTNLPRISYENFSYQDALGSEEIVNGDFSNGSANWTLETGWSVSDGKAFQDGTGSGNNGDIYQNLGLDTSKTYKLVLQVADYTQGTLYIDTNNTNLNINSVGTYTLYFTPLSSFLYIRTRFSGFVGSIDNVSVKEYLGQEVVPDSGCGSWLWEPQSTNLITQSELFSDASWVKSNTTIVSNVLTSPDGTINADNLKDTASNTIHRLRNGVTLLANTDYTISIFAKKGTLSNIQLALINTADSKIASRVFDLENGTLGEELTATGGTLQNSEIKDYGNGWYRCSITAQLTTTPNQSQITLAPLSSGNTQIANQVTYTGDGTGTVSIWGAMLEALSYPTSLIPTSGSTVTRNQDLCTNGATGTGLINSTEGVLYAEIAALEETSTSASNRHISLSSGSNNDRLYFYYTQSGQFGFAAFVGNVLQANIKYDGIITNNSKVACKYKENDYALWVDGVEVGTDTSASVWSSGTFDRIDFSEPNGIGSLFFGKTKALAVWKEALSDAELADLTYPTPTDPTFALDFDTIATDFTFARGSEATYVDAQGLIQSTNEIGEELITNGDFSNGSTDWQTEGFSSIVVGDFKGKTDVAKININNASTNSRIRQPFNYVSGKTYKVDIEVYVQSGNFRADGSDSFVSGDFVSTSTLGSWQTLTANVTAISTGLNYIWLRPISGVSEFYVSNVSVKEYITATNTPRLDYSTGAEAFLLEPQSTNLIPYSEDFSQWNAGGDTTIESGYLAPDGTNNAYKVSGTSSAIVFGASLLTTTTRSIYARTVSGTGQAHLCSFNGNSNNLFTITEQWQRFEVNSATTTGAVNFYAVDFRNQTNLSEIILWGANATNDQDYATSYIPSNGSTVTRNQETCINATPEINSEEGVLYFEGAILGNDGTYKIVSLSDGTTLNVVRFYYSITDNRIVGNVKSNSGIVFDFNHVLQDSTDFLKIAISYRLNDFKMYVNGIKVASDATGNTPIGLNILTFNNGGGTSSFFGNTKDVQVYTKALSDAELIKLTT